MAVGRDPCMCCDAYVPGSFLLIEAGSCNSCNTFLSVASVDKCTKCSSNQTSDCISAVCAAGHVPNSYSAGLCSSCDDAYASVPSVASCEVCVGQAVTDCIAATCAAGYSTFMAAGGYCCSDFADVTSVEACTECSGEQTSDCVSATCAAGYSTFMAGGGYCCSDFSSEPSVDVCTECTGELMSNCTRATCAVGYHSFSAETAMCLPYLCAVAHVTAPINGQLGDVCNGSETTIPHGASCDLTCSPGLTLINQPQCIGSSLSSTTATCCNDLSTEPSVVPGSCTECVGSAFNDCRSADCAVGYVPETFANGTCSPCSDVFVSIASVASCEACSGPEPRHCTSATCASGYVPQSYSDGICIECYDFASESSVVSGSCTTCTGPQAIDCTEATCASGYHSYANGSCCVDSVEERTSSGCACIAGFSRTSGCAPDYQCSAGTTCFKSADDGGCRVEADCSQCNGGYFSAAGESCQLCERGKVPVFGQSSCERCPAGSAPSADGTACEQCNSSTYSSFGIECIECPAPFVINDLRTSCSACSPGSGPNIDGSLCLQCADGWYSTFGICIECILPRVVSSDRASCVDPTMCAAGTQCLNSSGCDQQESCSVCPAGQISTTGGYCQTCDDSKVANVDHTFCEACLPGSAPSDDRSSCVQCRGTSYSALGIACTMCEAPNVVDLTRTTCSACAAGTGPNANRTECTSCVGTTYSTFGQCQSCDPPNVVDSEHLSCTACSPGQEPNANRTACIACTGTMFSSFGVQCVKCGTAQVPNSERTRCDDAGQVTELVTDLSVVEGMIGRNSTSNLLVQATLIVNASFHVLGSTSHEVWIQRLIRDVASALGMEVGQLKIANQQEGRHRRRTQSGRENIIAFVIDSPDPMDALRELAAQLNDLDSVLLNSPTAGAVLVPHQTPAFNFVCPAGMMRAAGDPQCTSCGGTQIPNPEQTACTECSPSTIPSADHTECVCDIGSYSVSSLPIIQCFDLDYFPNDPLSPSGENCYACPACLNCTTETVTLMPGYDFVASDAATTEGLNALKCPVPTGCPSRILHNRATASRTGALSQRDLIAGNCSEGFAGLLCAKCKEGYKMSPTKTCHRCSVDRSIWSPLLLLPIFLALTYFGFRKVLTFRRKKREEKVVAAKLLFYELANASTSLSRTSTGSSLTEVTREQMITGIRQLGLTLPGDVAHELLESIDIDHSDTINTYEFENWMEKDISRAKVRLQLICAISFRSDRTECQVSADGDDYGENYCWPCTVSRFDISILNMLRAT
eukprot:COSAG02_NODE_5333_length_4430_cov_2.392750_2_plen_1266_part_00